MNEENKDPKVLILVEQGKEDEAVLRLISNGYSRQEAECIVLDLMDD